MPRHLLGRADSKAHNLRTKKIRTEAHNLRIMKKIRTEVSETPAGTPTSVCDSTGSHDRHL